ncbi:amino acid adenylation domain-containing protein [Flavobacterium sp. N502540]|uniref:amino acid adenylation domain-containing protein n=1 Tax=Flavobacterium sp. N502540 TaxID=2986838 RepID=UPI00222520EE|nr:amino acid adenylation domain-containing protein [Flavobacterium sp. N502540]
MKLTLPQQDIYYEQLLYPNEPIYNIGAKIEIRGIIDTEVLKKAYVVLIDQHDAYRGRVTKVDENVEFKILDTHNSELGFIDFSGKRNSEEEADYYIEKEFSKVFNLFDNKLLHVFTLIKIREDFYYLFSVYHHIITDGWGTSLMFQRLVKNYNEILEFGEVKTVYPFSYQDFVQEDAVYQDSESFSEDRHYWAEKFKHLPENLFQKLGNATQTNKSSRKELTIGRDKYNLLSELAIQCKSSVFHVILGILYTYFGRKQQNYDFAIGLPVLNRSKATSKKTVGLFMGISPLRMQLDLETSFESLVLEIKNQLKKDYRHQRLPLGKLIKELQLFSGKERLFNISLSYEKQNYSDNFCNTGTSVIPLSHQSERVALAIYIREFDASEDVRIDFDYNLNYFDDFEISRIVNHFENLIDSVLADSQKELKSLSYLSAHEKSQLLLEFNNTKKAYPNDQTVLDLFEEQAGKAPDKIALIDDHQEISYAKLNVLSNKIAAYLLSISEEHDKSPIAVLLDRSVNMIAVLLGILKSGRSYLPLDPNFPKDRLNYIIGNSKAQIIITEKKYTANGISAPVSLKLEEVLEEMECFDSSFKSKVSSDDAAYIIYTSGSTGNPKGVEIGHQSLVNFLTSIQQKPGVTPHDLLFSVTTYSFDISVLEFFAPLISGATVFLASQETLEDPNSVIKKIKEINPSIIQATPSFYQMLFHAGWEGDKTLKVLCGGDLLSDSLSEKLITGTFEVWNMYGPTETTIWSSMKKLQYPSQASTIGTPINNTQFYILDDFFNLQPVGVIGSIYIAGDGLAKGYYRNEVLTREKFIENPFEANTLLYETGDLGKWNIKGEIEFLGRKDNQIKIRGYRIEAGEIESKLNLISGIKDSVVIAKKGTQQDAILVAYIIKSSAEINIEKIISELKLVLPYYMIPGLIIPMEQFPLTPNNKIDRKALLEMEVYSGTEDNEFQAPNSELEKKLLKYWQEVLEINKPISKDVNFFAIGGHSLNSVRLIGLIAKELSFSVSFKTIFDYPTIETLAEYLEKLDPVYSVELVKSEYKEFYEVTPSQRNIWLASQKASISIAYNMFAAFSIEGNFELEKIEKAVNEIIKENEILRTNFVESGEGIYQKINAFSEVNFSIQTKNIEGLEVKDEVNKFRNTEFNLQNDLLIKLKILERKNNEYLLLFCTHHIIMDGLSLELFIKKIISNLGEKNNTNLKSSTETAFQFKDYSEWFNGYLKDNSFKNKLFWEKYLRNFHFKNSFERDFNLENDNRNGEEYFFELTEDVTNDLKKLVIDKKVTLYTVLIAVLKILIFKESNQTDICVGTVNSGRNRAEINDQIGMFAKTIVLRTPIEKNKTFLEIVKNVQRDLFEIEDYSDVPFEEIGKSVFDVMLVYQNPEFNFENIDDLKLTRYPVEGSYSRMPVVFNFYGSGKIVKGNVDFDRNLFDRESINAIVAKYNLILQEIIENPSQCVELMNIELELDKKDLYNFDFNF